MLLLQYYDTITFRCFCLCLVSVVVCARLKLIKAADRNDVGFYLTNTTYTQVYCTGNTLSTGLEMHVVDTKAAVLTVAPPGGRRWTHLDLSLTLSSLYLVCSFCHWSAETCRLSPLVDWQDWVTTQRWVIVNCGRCDSSSSGWGARMMDGCWAGQWLEDSSFIHLPLFPWKHTWKTGEVSCLNICHHLF